MSVGELRGSASAAQVEAVEIASIRRVGVPTVRMLLSADVVGLVIAFAIAEVAAGRADSGRLSILDEGTIFALTIPLWIVVSRWYGLYEHDSRRADHGTADEIVSLFHLSTVGTWLLWIVCRESGLAAPAFSKIAVFWLASVATLTATRSAGRALLRHRSTQDAQLVVVVGAGVAGQAIARKIAKHPEYGLRLVAFLDPDPRVLDPLFDGVPVLHATHSLLSLAESGRVHRVIFAYSRRHDEDWLDLVSRLRAIGLQVDVVPRLFEMMGARAELHRLEGLELMTLPPQRLPQDSRAKRVLDLVGASVALILLAPLLLAISLMIRLGDSGPIIYRSTRIGSAGGEFTLYKFRTMLVGADDMLRDLLRDERTSTEFWSAHKLTDDPRLTRAGRWLRRFSLDELPQLVNVLHGDLSLVGPRPITLREHEEIMHRPNYGNGAAALASPSWRDVRGYWDVDGVRPGITGLWQICGRSDIHYGERVRLDKLYAANWSLASDLMIMVKTLRTVATTRGAN